MRQQVATLSEQLQSSNQEREAVTAGNSTEVTVDGETERLEKELTDLNTCDCRTNIRKTEVD